MGAWEATIQTYIDDLAPRDRERIAETNAVTYFLSFVNDSRDYSHKFWIRSDPTVFAESAYNGGTTYAEGDRVESSDAVWESLQDSNTGNTPAEDEWWTKKYDLDSDTGDWCNLQVRLGVAGGTASGTLYKWNEGTDNWDSVQVFTTLNNPFYEADTYYLSLAPGRYKIDGNVTAYAGLVGNRADIRIDAAQWDNTMSADEKVRCFDTQYYQLTDQILTETLIRSGRLTSPNYEGGTELGDD
jgi:hypothetical protein